VTVRTGRRHENAVQKPHQTIGKSGEAAMPKIRSSGRPRRTPRSSAWSSFEGVNRDYSPSLAADREVGN
jgi:hypothetical protein